MLTRFQPTYIFFYLQGREADKPRNLKLELEEIADKALAGPDDVHTVIRAAVELAMKPFEQGAKRRDWIADNSDDIFAAGGDNDSAYAHYLQGRIDEYTYKITNPVLDVMIEETCDGDDEDEVDAPTDGVREAADDEDPVEPHTVMDEDEEEDMPSMK